MKRTNKTAIALLSAVLLSSVAVHAATFPPKKVNEDSTEKAKNAISEYPEKTTVQLKPVVRNERKNMTQLWLNMQTRGQMATTETDMLTPEAAKATQLRMQQSFSHPIPDKFIKDGFTGS
ncbi:DUF3613 domain-containing protein [Photobacterium galatheae]|uniref:Uncharacterized protein n=1 Tax=Photobacterium galatheae TaxID=1654360 RepID=A0A066RRV6_9GAMM|nr:DUF3613 domain-containing protein [Photobacterium galatheae]KDM90123.1 hypothetical protein EA58_19510 [Photobacterium galatheae]MCM0151613.1 DUF3613 domain-containing protein [Photobacterium galatheae]